MKTQVKKVGDALVVSIDGKLNFETQDEVRSELTRIARQTRTDSSPKRIIFNLEKLEFVGSSGISSFVQALKDFNGEAAQKPLYCNVRSEFQRIIKAFDEDNAFEFFDNEERARRSFDN
jgi:anti-anti-sigma factor